METTVLGKTGLQVSRLGAGLAEIGTLDPSTASQVLNAALDGGISFLDTSPCYGRSEEWIGRSIGHRRHEYVLATKAGHVIFYEAYDEETRLSRDNMHRVEFITAVHVLDQEIPKGSKILDVAAGVGKYAFYYASQGHQVWAQDIVVAHVDRMRHIVQETGVANVDVACGDARDLRRFQDGFFDVVLCMGPIYHIADQQE